MTITIEPEALQADKEKWLRPGSLYAIRRLIEAGYPVRIDTGRLGETQREQLLKDAPDLAGKQDGPEASLIYDSEKGLFLLVPEEKEPVASARDLPALVRSFLFPEREVELNRATSETDIRIRLNLDGRGESRIATGLNFFDHMLDQIARHGLIDLEIDCDGDLEVDEHHTIEDTAILLGDALFEVCGKNKIGIQRYGFLLAMDEAGANVALDLSGRPYLVWKAEFNREYVGDFPLEMAEHFFHTLAMHMRATLRIEVEGSNEHHKLEAIFKGFARALRFAVTRSERSAGLLPSSKGAL